MKWTAALSLALWSWLAVGDSLPSAAIGISPPSIVLDSPESSQQLLVKGPALQNADADAVEQAAPPPDGPVDLTRTVTYECLDTRVAAVDERGLVTPRGEGRTMIVVRHGDATAEVPVEVTGLAQPTPIAFQQDVIPILTKAGCNAGGCHGKAEGQNGFKLSVFGFDPAADYDALVKQGRGRRVFPAAPEQSLVLRKATGQEPHGGGKRIEPDSLRYRRLLRWITEGAGNDESRSAAIEALEVEPSEQSLAAGGAQQLRATAIDASGRRRCVTTEAEYSSNAPTLAEVDGSGYVQANNVPGEAAVLVRYLGQVAVCRITIPRPGVRFVRPPENNFVDRLVWDKLERLGIAASMPADDATFLRRVFLDTIGTLPTADEARAFLADGDPGKRLRLIEHLLARDEYADYWTMRFSDILRVDKVSIAPQGAMAMTRWLRRQMAENRPYDELVREIIVAQGDSYAESPVSFYKALNTPDLASRAVSQAFLGVRIECAQCHHHPFEKWGQDDYYGLAGFFTGLGRKPLASGGEAVFAVQGADLNHPRTAAPVPTRALGAPAAEPAGAEDRRAALADWMTAPENPYFATAIANRLWAHYFGRGLVEPIDDLRATNPPSNEPLLAALAEHVREVDYDLRAFTRTLLSSQVYQLSSLTNESNADDGQNFSHAANKAQPAEVLLDALCQVTEAPEKFNGWPAGYRAIQVWDNQMPSYFFRIFGRPERVSVCECERSNEPSIAQALHLMNSAEIGGKIQSRHGRARRLADSDLSPRDVIDELYLATLARYPAGAEMDLVLGLFAAGDRRVGAEDALWALVNSKEFIYNH